MNNSELVVEKYFTKRGHNVERGRFNQPDFLIDDKFFVEVKNRYSTGGCWLSLSQEISFIKINKPI